MVTDQHRTTGEQIKHRTLSDGVVRRTAVPWLCQYNQPTDRPIASRSYTSTHQWTTLQAMGRSVDRCIDRCMVEWRRGHLQSVSCGWDKGERRACATGATGRHRHCSAVCFCLARWRHGRAVSQLLSLVLSACLARPVYSSVSLPALPL